MIASQKLNVLKQSNAVSKKASYKKAETRELTLLTLPALVLLFVFQYIPMAGIILAFKDFRYNLGILGSKWIGFKNFDFFFKSQDAWRVTRNTVGYNMVFIITVVVGAVLLAVLLSEVKSKLQIKLYQTVMFLPYYLSWTVVAFIGYCFFHTDLGILNQILQGIGMEKISWYSDPKVWIIINPIAHFWKVIGYNLIIFYAGLMSLDQTYYEAAEIDGASRVQMFRSITLPLLAPLIIVMTLLMLGKIFNADFGQFYLLTKDSGAIYSTTDVIDTYVYRSLRVVGDIGMASAVGLYQSVVGFVLVIITNKIVRKYNADCSLY